MTSGVYQLKFRNGSTYIGKSVDIGRRWEEHVKSLAEGKSAKKLQDAYNKLGVPTRSILVECHPDHISLVETLMIRRLKPTLNSASTAPLSTEDNAILACNLDNLNTSTGRMLYNTITLSSHVNRLENEIDFLLDEDKVASSLYASREHIKELSLRLAKLGSELEKEKAVTWWQRLWR